ncbi:MAG: SDR family oxidoreductase [Gammaproteobacteria bacterium]|nr:SDR family oxidoreductase [Gammaproteobacteria bacterium]
MLINDKVAVVTGAASGIGHAVSEELIKRGALAVAMVDMSKTVVEVADKLNKDVDKNAAIPYVGDVTDPDFRKRVFDELCEKHEVVNICVPAAGIFRDRMAVKIDKETSEPDIYPLDLFRMVLDVNLLHPIYWSMEMVARMAQHRHKNGLKKWHPDEIIQGSVVFIGSVASQGNKGQISYATTKAGLEGAATTLMKESMYHGVRTAVIHPGFVDTPILQGMPEGYVENYILPDTQLGRLIKPEEIADAICFLITNSAVSGELWADAGWHPPAN